jgi:hypothetical protein
LVRYQPTMLLACGACSDALLESRHWWLGGAPVLFLTLLVEGAVFGLVTWAMKLRSVAPRVHATVYARLLLTLSMFLVGMGLGLAFALLVLIPAAFWSLFRNFRGSPVLTSARVAILCAALGAGLWEAWPSHRSVDHLLDVAITAARLRVVDSWIVDELRHRPGPVSELERRVSESPEASMLELHAALRGPPEFRRTYCERLLKIRSADSELRRVRGPVIRK